jgi:flagellar hook-associated protein 1 FlgK
MGLNGALQIGQSALLASQAAIQVAGNNMANAATPGYHRQVAEHWCPPVMTASASTPSSAQACVLRDISRVVDTALQSRIRGAISRESGDLDRSALPLLDRIASERTQRQRPLDAAERVLQQLQRTRQQPQRRRRPFGRPPSGERHRRPHQQSLRSEYTQVRE